MQVPVGDAILYVEQHGAGPDLVLLHGMGMASARVWNLVAPELAKRCRVLLYDLRGCGRSTDPSGDQSIARHTADLVALLDHLGIVRTHLVGFSFSGFLAQQMALDHPERVRSLTLLSTTAELPPGSRSQRVERALLVERDGVAAYADEGMGRTFSPHFFSARPDLVAWYREQFLANDRASYVGAMRALLDLSFRRRLGELRCPTLIIGGADDTHSMVGPRPVEAMRDLQQLIPNSELVMVPEVRHYVQIERPESFLEALCNFIDRVERG